MGLRVPGIRDRQYLACPGGCGTTFLRLSRNGTKTVSSGIVECLACGGVWNYRWLVQSFYGEVTTVSVKARARSEAAKAVFGTHEGGESGSQHQLGD